MLQEQLNKIIQSNFASNLQGSLVLEISYSQLKICIADQLSSEILACSNKELSTLNKETYLQSIEQILSHNVFSKAFKKVSVLINTDKSILVPEALFTPEKKEEILSLHFIKNNDEVILISNIKGTGTICAFIINKDVYAILIRKFPNVKVKSMQEKTIELSNQINHSSSLFAHCSSEKLHIVVKQNRNLLLSNCYIIKSNEDAAYYIYFVLEQLKLSQEDTPIILSGTFHDTKTLLELLKRYSKTVALHFDTKSSYTSYDSIELKPEERVHLISEA